MSGRPKDPDYWRKWRAAHPEYRERENLRRAIAKRSEDRTVERQLARARKARAERIRAYNRERMARARAAMSDHERAQERHVKAFRWRLLMHAREFRGLKRRPQGAPHRVRRAESHMKRAEAIVSEFAKPDRGAVIFDPLYEDALGVALLATYEHLKDTRHGESRVRDAVASFVKAERAWVHRTGELVAEAPDPAYVACIHGYMRAGWCWDCAREEAAA
jgi:hypothetical protein